MKRWGWRRPSPALLIACLALFVALGGTVLAATKIDGRTIRVNSLPGNRLTVGSLPGNRLRTGTIPGSRLAPGSVKADQIDVGSLGPVPSAAHADSADTARRAQTAIAADHAADATTVNGRSVGCRASTREFAGACWDLRPSDAAVTGPEAAVICAAAGGELPEAMSLSVFAGQTGISIALDGEWTRQIASVGSPGAFSLMTVTSQGLIHSAVEDQPHHFRCVTPLLS
jgi:hypothetical protein